MKLQFLTLLTMLTLLSCKDINTNFDNKNSLKELKRINSFDKKVDAVLVETNGGATSSIGNAIFLVTPGKKVVQDDLNYAVFHVDHYQNVDIKWEANKLLLISYNKARIFSYTNFWQTDEIDNWKYVVEVKLQCLSTDGQLQDADKHPMTN